MNLTEEQVKAGNILIVEFEGYVYHEYNVLVDYSDIGGIYTEIEVHSKTPIEVNEYDDGEKYFKNVPNPDYENHNNPKWSPDLETLSWASLNEYISDLSYFYSYNTLMPVIHKLSDVISEYDQQFAGLKIFELGLFTPLDELFVATVEAITWYNKEKEELKQAYKNYGDSHTTFRSQNCFVTPMEYSFESFCELCKTDRAFYKKYKN